MPGAVLISLVVRSQAMLSLSVVGNALPSYHPVQGITEPSQYGPSNLLGSYIVAPMSSLCS